VTKNSAVLHNIEWQFIILYARPTQLTDGRLIIGTMV